MPSSDYYRELVNISTLYRQAPQLAQFGTLTSVAIASTLLGSAIVGVVCGWLYWRRSLVAAILAHFAVDLIIQVVPAIWT